MAGEVGAVVPRAGVDGLAGGCPTAQGEAGVEGREYLGLEGVRCRVHLPVRTAEEVVPAGAGCAGAHGLDAAAGKEN